MNATELSPYLEHLRALPFVRGVAVRKTSPDRFADYELVIRTTAGSTPMLVELKKSHVSPQWIEQWARASKGSPRRLLFAPTIGQQLGARLIELGIAFVDRAGNMALSLGEQVAHIQGRRGERRASGEKALRPAAYRALFALLAEPTLADAPVRTLADAAAVSRQAASDIRHRLEAQDVLYARNKRFGWTPRGAAKALEIFLGGYSTTLRPQLVVGRYRTRHADLSEIESRIVAALDERDDFRWGGGAACMRLTHYYRGERTVIHMSGASPRFLRAIQAIPDREGALEIVAFPGPLARQGATPDTAHPLLVYAELTREKNDRAQDAARQILERWLPSGRFA